MGQPLFDALRCLDTLVSPTSSLDPSVWVAALAVPLISRALQRLPLTADTSSPQTAAAFDDDDELADTGSMDEYTVIQSSPTPSSDELDESFDDGDDESSDDSAEAEPQQHTVKLNRRMRRAMLQQSKAKQRQARGTGSAGSSDLDEDYTTLPPQDAHVSARVLQVKPLHLPGSRLLSLSVQAVRLVFKLLAMTSLASSSA